VAVRTPVEPHACFEHITAQLQGRMLLLSSKHGLFRLQEAQTRAIHARVYIVDRDIGVSAFLGAFDYCATKP
jgi:hypothetical protein